MSGPRPKPPFSIETVPGATGFTESSAPPRPRTLAGVAWQTKLRLSLILTDGLAVATAIVSAQLLRFGPRPAPDYVVLGLGLWVGLMVALWATRARKSSIIGVGLEEYRRVINATFLTYAALAIAALHFHAELARGYLAIAVPGALALLVLGRTIWRGHLQRLRRVGRCLTDAIVVGSRSDVVRAVSELRSNLAVGYRAVAVALTDAEDRSSRELHELLSDLPTIDLDDLAHAVRSSSARAVMIAGDLPGGRDQIRDIGWMLEDLKTELILVSRLTDVAGPRIQLRPVVGLPMVHVELPQYSGFTHGVKRAFDIVVAGVLLVLLSPVFAAVALAIRLEGGGPVLFRQTRVGVRGTWFTMLKFRSMVVNADERLSELKDQNEGDGVLFKMRNDPRVTRVGRFLRRSSLDELPQLLNVLGGSMSLVGPRPPLPAEVELYEDRVARRLLIKPGITGLWQVRGRSNLSWEESVKLDLYYVENWSIVGDLVILALTARAVLAREGAY
jgi:exopolysaccharide biosynthesis polyprenyl glycosylphosphotransferase